jgi:hypothetical protein
VLWFELVELAAVHALPWTLAADILRQIVEPILDADDVDSSEKTERTV